MIWILGILYQNVDEQNLHEMFQIWNCHTSTKNVYHTQQFLLNRHFRVPSIWRSYFWFRHSIVVLRQVEYIHDFICY